MISEAKVIQDVLRCSLCEEEIYICYSCTNYFNKGELCYHDSRFTIHPHYCSECKP